MIFSYGNGVYQEGKKRLEGTITLSEHKIYLRLGQEDLTASYVPLEKIDYLRLTGKSLQVHVKPTISSQFIAVFTGESLQIKELAKDLVQRRGFKKKFLKNEWYEVPQ